MEDPFKQVTEQIDAASELPDLLTATHTALELADKAASALVDQAEDLSYPAYATAQLEATEAVDALRRAPSLTRSADQTTPPTASNATLGEPGGQSPDALADALVALAMVTTRALVEAAEKSTDPADKIACLEAALHAGRLHETLKATRPW